LHGLQRALAFTRIHVVTRRGTRDVVHGSNGGRTGRLVGETLRTLINGTFRGVSAHWLPAYLAEAMTRSLHRTELVKLVLARLLSTDVSLGFAKVAERSKVFSFGAG
jgi:hypothetical protein